MIGDRTDAGRPARPRLRGPAGLRLGIWWCLLGLVPLPAFAQPTVTAEVDAQEIGDEDDLVFVVRIRGKTGRVATPSLPEIPGFRVMSGPTLSTMTQIVNWETTLTREYRWVLLPRQQGQFTIPTLTVEVDGETYQTKPIAVTVKAGEVKPRPRAGRRSWDPFGRRQPSNQQISGKVEMEAVVTKREVFVGEPVLLSYQLVTNVAIDGLRMVQVPEYRGFLTEEVAMQEPDHTTEVRDRSRYDVYTVKKTLLIPLEPGTLEVESTLFQMDVRVRGGGAFDFSLFDRSRTVQRKTRSIPITVKPLPVAGRPADFSGGVGRFRLRSIVSATEDQVNEPITLEVTLEGEGNFRRIESPALPTLADFKVYDPEVQDQVEVDGATLKGTRTWQYVIVPTAPGPQEIPPLRFTFFDPRRERYQTVTTASHTVQVARGATPEPTVVALGGDQRQVKLVGRDIHFLKPAMEPLKDEGRLLHRSPWFALAFLLPLLLNVGTLLTVRYRERLLSDPSRLRARGASRTVEQRMQAAKKLLTTDGDGREFHHALHQALVGYAADRCDLAPGVTTAELQDHLATTGMDPAQIKAVVRLLEACDRAEYMPAGGQAADRQSRWKEAQTCLAVLRKALP